MQDLAVIILTHNEALHIERALRLVKGTAREIFVIDSFSSDGTVELARAHGAIILQHKFINYSKQFQWALDNAPITANWVMRLDADEEIEPDLASEIATRLPMLPETVVGVNLKRKHIFLGRWIRHGGRYPLILLRIWRRGKGRIEDRWMDEHMVVTGGCTVTFDGGFSDHNLNDLTFFTEKHNKYATREAVDVLNKKYRWFALDQSLSEDSSSRQAAAKRFLKEAIYNKVPFWLAASSYFFYRYTLQLGFLDGQEGLIYHFLQGFWYRFLVGAKIIEFEHAISRFSDKETMLNELRRITKLDLSRDALTRNKIDHPNPKLP